MSVHVVEAEENLVGYLLDNVHRHPLGLVALDETEEVFAQNFEHHAHVGPVLAVMPKVVEERDDMTATYAMVELCNIDDIEGVRDAPGWDG